ncbi:MAG: NAD(P)/FAD-dependent oxidoreductase [Dysgonamonadaceae bacterium]
MKKIIVVGCGFGGLQFVKHLKKNTYEIIIIDKANHHQFPPLFYQVAASQIEPATISFPIRKIFQNRPDIRIHLANVNSVNAKEKTIDTSIGKFNYDYLIIASGAKTNFFGNVETEENALGLKSTFQAMHLRNVILENFERLLYVEDKDPYYNIVVVGGGATGVEVSGALAEMKKEVLPRDFPNIDFSKLNIYMVEGAQHTLSAMSEFSQRNSEKYLRELGVDIHFNTFVKSYDGDKLTFANGNFIRTKSVIWSAGVIGNTIDGIPSESVLRNGRIKVNHYNKVEGLDDIFAIGDIAYMETEKYPRGHPQLANVAIGQARNLAKNLQKRDNGKSEFVEYEYKNLGTMATVGRNKAVVDLPFAKFKGRFAWFIWMFLHLMLILSVRNKLVILINWARYYFTQNNSLRLILSDPDKKE